PVRVIRKAKPPAPMPAEPREPRRFRVADVISRRNLVDDASAAEAIDTLRAVRSIVDVNIYVWQPDRGRCRLLTFSEQRAMFDLAAAPHAAHGAVPYRPPAGSEVHGSFRHRTAVDDHLCFGDGAATQGWSFELVRIDGSAARSGCRLGCAVDGALQADLE